MTTAISYMETAYTAAAGDNGTPTVTELRAGHVNGLRLEGGGLFKWSSSVSITTDLTFDAKNNNDAVWIMQIAKTLSLGSGASITLENGAQPMNIFWQVAESTSILSGAHAQGIILCKTSITFGSGATLTGRALAQTAVTMIATTVTAAPHQAPTASPTSAPPAPTEQPTEEPTVQPTEEPTEQPTEEPTEQPTEEPTEQPTEEPTEQPTEEPTEQSTEELTEQPTEELTEQPTEDLTEQPTEGNTRRLVSVIV